MPKIGLTLTARALAVALAASPLPNAARADPPAAYGARRAEAVTFRDWRLHCRGKTCVLRARVEAADGSRLLGARLTATTLAFDTTLPLLLPDGVTLALGSDPLRQIPWRTCGAQGCTAETPLDEGLLASLKRERQAEVTFTLLDGIRVRLPVSLLGITAALDAQAAVISP